MSLHYAPSACFLMLYYSCHYRRRRLNFATRCGRSQMHGRHAAISAFSWAHLSLPMLWYGYRTFISRYWIGAWGRCIQVRSYFFSLLSMRRMAMPCYRRHAYISTSPPPKISAAGRQPVTLSSLFITFKMFYKCYHVGYIASLFHLI